MRSMLVLAAVLVSGCAATQIQVDYLSDPPGATLYEGGKALGVTPTSLYYAIEPSFENGGCQRARGTSVMWASGAKTEIGHLSLCKNNGYRQNYSFSRPDVPGRDVDLNYALQLQRNSIMRQQADAATMQAIQAMTPAPPRPVTSNSFRVGAQVQTNCY